VSAIAQRFATTAGARQRILDSLARDLGAVSDLRAGSSITAVALEGFETAQRALHIFLNELPQAGTVKGDAVRAYVRELDRALADVALEHPEHLIVLCSPSAVTAPALPANVWAMATPSILSGDPGADDGFLLVTGPGATHRENPAPARPVDLVPTILFGAGLPVARDMDGRILTDAFTDDMLRRSTLSVIQTYEAERLIVRRARP
jgi:hypothetical protein